jgi:adenosylhomocysteinase
MEEFQVKDETLAPQGHLQIEWASAHMPVLNQIKNRFKKEKPFKGLTLGACLHVTKETAVLADALVAGGAQLALCGSNPLSTQDDVAAALAERGVNVFAWRGQQTWWALFTANAFKTWITLKVEQKKQPQVLCAYAPWKPRAASNTQL